MSIGETMKTVKPYMAMVFLQFGFAGMYIISVASLKRGMNHYVLVVYRNAIAAVVMAPFALWFERKTRPKMTVRIFIKIIALGLLEPVLDQNMNYMGSMATSAGFSATLMNTIPVITFVIATALRIEKINIKMRHSQAKVVGTLITISGALLMILYKGPVVNFVWSKGGAHHNSTSSTKEGSNWLKGTFLLLGSCTCWSGFYIVQANTLESYPAELSLTTWICGMGAALSSLVTFAVEGLNAKPWSIGWDMRLLTAVYAGVVCSGIAYYVQGIVMKERGPVFVTAFNPLCMIITAVMGSIVLAEEITLGRVIGAAVIVIGLYCLIWGKSKDYLSKTEKDFALDMPVSAKASMNSSNKLELQVIKRDEL